MGDETEENTSCACGKESDYAGHGVRDQAVYTEYHCKECYNKKE